MWTLPERMSDAADTLEEVSALYGFAHPEHAQWTAADLRAEMTTLRRESHSDNYGN
jgi:hypothetical protein